AARELGEMVRAIRLNLLPEAGLMRNAAVERLVRDAGHDIEQREIARARTDALAERHVADHVVLDERDDLGPELRLAHMRVDVDQEVVFVALGLLGGMRENIARVGSDRDLVELTKVLSRRAFEHRRQPQKTARRAALA